MHTHRRLPIFEGGKLLRASNRNGGVAWDDFFDQTAHGFNPQREWDDIEQQHFCIRLIAGQNVRLNRRTNRHNFVWVDAGQWCAAKKLPHLLAHKRCAG
ncbi:NAD-specific glutamate dehydrogenase [Vibrio cholerae]|nr:NAD-specific glutamate dehydrogenase [Vibrio cholerae]CSA57060.1 NAD-specific glutamate dehydrogenase [Vibrio cholerae]CSA75153.1 NAD-specific glutamate dehydrogenase [Vibrio cholerae]CSB50525.1 NAD-specific glutamate dehydrogenase [Vibrio cholerae]CSC78072.1 NAD-specific glutamate dehydrogenase [Vibrio cholerae]